MAVLQTIFRFAAALVCLFALLNLSSVQNGVLSGALLINSAQAATCGVVGDVVDQLPAEIAEVLGDGGPDASSDKGQCITPPKATDVSDEKPINAPLVKTYQSANAIVGAHVPDEVLVTVSADEGVVERLRTTYGLTVRSQKVITLLGSVLVRFGIPDGRPVAVVRAQLLGAPGVLQAEPNHIYQLNGKADNGKAGSALKRYSMVAAEINSAQKQALGRGVKIAIIDTGVDENHPALTGAVRGRFNALENTPLNITDHGTAVALLAGGGDKSFMGAAPESELYVARAFDKTKNGVSVNAADAIIASLDWAFQQDVDIVNMSFAGPENKLITKSIQNLLKLNVILVAAAGNNGSKAPFAYPAATKGVFAVTATDAKNRVYSKANQGPYVYVSAPGVDLIITDGAESVQLRSGTSYGAALFSGICALAMEGRKGMPLKNLRNILERSTRDLGPPGRDPTFGIGLIRAAELLRQVAK